MADSRSGVASLNEALSPQAKDALQHLELFARRTVQGVLHGIHRSKRKGVSTEFDHHKNYQPGDPLKHMDWKVSARLDRYYVKRYLEDTALSVRLVLDRSASMRQASSGVSKYLQAARIAASLAYLVLNQRDAVSLFLVSGSETLCIPSSSSSSQLVLILRALVSREAETGDALQPCLRTLLDRAERRGLVVAVSDLMCDPMPVQRELARLHAQGHEILLFQPRDPTEEDFPFNRWVEFRDLENDSVRCRVDAVPLKKIYREEYQTLVEDWRSWCKKYHVHFVSFRTERSVETVLSEYLAFRARVI
ncbi:MAG: DUF58 domain-containing protein [Planctomycetes bacterium]|nr:DUF58 domain-containing protein [Planctomycetota bacterium]